MRYSHYHEIAIGTSTTNSARYLYKRMGIISIIRLDEHQKYKFPNDAVYRYLFMKWPMRKLAKSLKELWVVRCHYEGKFFIRLYNSTKNTFLSVIFILQFSKKCISSSMALHNATCKYYGMSQTTIGYHPHWIIRCHQSRNFISPNWIISFKMLSK